MGVTVSVVVASALRVVHLPEGHNDVDGPLGISRAGREVGKNDSHDQCPQARVEVTHEWLSWVSIGDLHSACHHHRHLRAASPQDSAVPV